MDRVLAPADAVDACLLSDLSADVLGLEMESWSLAVSPEFCKQHDRHTVKRQDVIYGRLASLNIVLCVCAFCTICTACVIEKWDIMVESNLSEYSQEF